jgi:hypothetical protein
MNGWSRATFPNRLQSLRYHHEKHGKPGQSLMDYAMQGVRLSQRVVPNGRMQTVRGSGGGKVNGKGKTVTSW